MMTLMRQFKDPVSGLTHLFGAVASAVGLVILVRKGIAVGDALAVAAFAVFGAGLLLLYAASATYHLARVSERAQLVLRKIDHIMIFVLIASTYTPVCAITLRGRLGYSMLALVWGFAVAGAVLKLFFLNVPRWVYTGVYLGLGWLAVTLTAPILRAVGVGPLLWMVAGGLMYTVGAVIYGVKRPNPLPGVLGFHEIFHIFILMGSACHYVFIYNLA